MLTKFKHLLLKKLRKRSFNKLLKSALHKSFKFEDIIISDYQIQLETIAFAKSFANLNGERITAYRNLERSNRPSWETTNVTVSLRNTELVFERGEDPRLFTYNSQNWIMIQKFIPAQKDIDIVIYNLETNKSFSLQSPLGFNGKNWVPYENDSNLYFIYSLEPFVVMKANFAVNEVDLIMVKEEKNFKPTWEHDPAHSVGWVRGGTPALKVPNKEYYVGFSHSINNNHDIHCHTFGMYLFNPRTFEIQHAQLSKYTPNLLIDPYGLRLSEKECEIDISIGLFDIHDSSSTVVNVTYILDIFDMIHNNFSETQLKAVE
jgi:hypothetical protein